MRVPKFSEVFSETLNISELSESYRKNELEMNIKEYAQDLSETELTDFINIMDYSNLFTETDEEGKIVPTALIKTSKKILDSLTDGNWSKFSKEEKSNFLKNYVWNGTKFVPTKTGRVKAVVAGISASATNSLKPKEIISNLATTSFINIVTKAIKSKTINNLVIKSALKSVPQGATLSAVILALASGAYASAKTTPDNAEEDFAKKFDDGIKKAKSKIRILGDKLKSLFAKK